MLTELRGVWLTNIDSDVLFLRDHLTDAIQRLSKLQFNNYLSHSLEWELYS